MNTNHQPVTQWGKIDAYRWELTNRIAAVLHANGDGIRPFYTYIATVPEGGMSQLIDEVPFSGVRAEIGGTTVSVEITTQRKGDVSTADQMRYACYDFDEFSAWFYNLLRRLGQRPALVKPINLLHGYYRPAKTQTSLRPALSSIRHKRKRR